MVANNLVRIISGKWRGRKIGFPSQAGLRPTHDRVRETLFNWLASYIAEANCLDLFAGSGVIGFEALSRGANSVLFIDENATVVEELRKNKRTLGASSADILQATIPSPLIQIEQLAFDIIFLDPPYHENLIEASLLWLKENDRFKVGTLIYIECEIDYDIESVLMPGMNIEKSKRTSAVAFYLVEVISIW